MYDPVFKSRSMVTNFPCNENYDTSFDIFKWNLPKMIVCLGVLLQMISQISKMYIERLWMNLRLQNFSFLEIVWCGHNFPDAANKCIALDRLNVSLPHGVMVGL